MADICALLEYLYCYKWTHINVYVAVVFLTPGLA